ncbi:MAG: hypothetical protein K8R49_02535 [Candidatus Cloacimonetes bacterium]|nr:hypothetical protein [Candidatus Cloacimonadota bacterium]
MNFTFKLILLIVIAFVCTSLLAEEINPRINILKSAVIPGWGELSSKNSSGYIFLATELMFWSSHFYFIQEAELKDKASYNYAVKYAHIEPGDYSDQYFYHLTRYENYGFETGGYNAHIVETAKNKYPDDPVAQTEYINANIYSDDFFWEWDNDDRKHDYSILRKRITQYNDYAKAFTGAIIANHIISMINSARISSKLKRLNAGVQFDSNMNPMIICNYRF